jgi:hypothetical protein
VIVSCAVERVVSPLTQGVRHGVRPREIPSPAAPARAAAPAAHTGSGTRLS